MYVYIKRFHFICKILFFSFSLFFFLQKMMTRLKEKISYITFFQNGSRSPLKTGPPGSDVPATPACAWQEEGR